MDSRDFKLDLNGSKASEQIADNTHIEQDFKMIQVRSGKLKLNGETVACSWDNLKFICELGSGSCGHVSKYVYHNVPMAVKIMPRTDILDENKRILMDLAVITKTVDCPNLIHCYGFFISVESVRVCMEIMATCLDKLLKKLKSPFPQGIVGAVAVSVVDALSYLKNKHKIIHRDVKPANILMDFDGNIKLCDFGISGFLVESLAHTAQAGCPPYMAPERLTTGAFYTSYDVRSDAWSLGITTVELATGRYPYAVQCEFDCMAAIIVCPPPRLKKEDGFASDLCAFIDYVLNKNVCERPNYLQILQHPYIIRSRKEVPDVGTWLENMMNEDEVME